MTESVHVYSAVVIGPPDVPLGIRGGTLMLDDAAAPHVTASLAIAWPDEQTLELLDPRAGARIRVTATAEYTDATQARTFDLALRNRTARHADAALVLELASDEALLTDRAALQDDAGAFDLASSLRAVVDYVLDKAIPGAALEPVPSDDADVTPYWAVTNRVNNPAAENTTGFELGLNAKALGTGAGGVVGSRFVWWQSVAAGASYLHVLGDSRVSAGDRIVGYASLTASATLNGLVFLRFTNSEGVILHDAFSAPTATPAWPQVVAYGTAPEGATDVQMIVQINATAANQTLGADGFMMYNGDRVVPYFDGAKSADAHYSYTWNGPAYNSSSKRVPVVERSPESLVWPAGVSALDFLRPLVQAAGFRLVCDELRRWSLRDENYSAAGAIAVRYAVNLIDGTDVIDRDAGLWFDAQVTLYRWTDRAGIRHERVDAFAMTSPALQVNRVEIDAPYPGPGRSAYAVRRAQSRGREVTATAVADWRADAEQPVTVVLDAAPIQTGLTSRIVFDLSTDRMTITTRSTDTPVDAIDLLVGTIDALVGTIDAL